MLDVKQLNKLGVLMSTFNVKIKTPDSLSKFLLQHLYFGFSSIPIFIILFLIIIEMFITFFIHILKTKQNKKTNKNQLVKFV